MHMSVEILPEAEALIRRAGQGRERPNSQAVGVVPTPKGRTTKALWAQLLFSWQTHRSLFVALCMIIIVMAIVSAVVVHVSDFSTEV
jgi:hypothetical protein